MMQIGKLIEMANQHQPKINRTDSTKNSNIAAILCDFNQEKQGIKIRLLNTLFFFYNLLYIFYFLTFNCVCVCIIVLKYKYKPRSIARRDLIH